jgi:hypothetical protein
MCVKYVHAASYHMTVLFKSLQHTYELAVPNHILHSPKHVAPTSQPGFMTASL